jgi:DNA-binding GntR family transcriptional regulator
LHLFDSLHMLARSGIDTRIEQVFGSDFGPLTSTHDEHLEFAEAIRAHDPQRAEASMRDHLTSIRRALFGDRH